MDDASGLERTARTAAAAGDWAAARAAFEALVAQEASGEALAGLGDVLWWLGETDEAVSHQERAYAAFRATGDVVNSVMTAVGLYLTTRVSLGQRAAARGWLGRAARLVDEHGLAPAAGWVALLQAHDCADPVVAERLAERAREVAREFGDADLELCALSQCGAALVQQGQVDSGTALLDEAMAASLAGEGSRPHTRVFTSCLLIGSCALVADVDRVGQWVSAAERFADGPPAAHLHATCQVSLASVLVAAGRLVEAEQALDAALEVGTRGEPALRAQAMAQLADIRLAQGRLEEAERLLEGLGQFGTSQLPLARLAAARGDSALARRLVEQRLQLLDLEADAPGPPEAHRPGLASVFERAGLLELLAALADDEVAARAVAGLERLADVAPPLRATALRARGRAGGGVQALEAAVVGFTAAGWPLEAARTRLDVAAQLEGEQAAAELQLAFTALARMGATYHADRAAASLRRLGITAARPAGGGADDLTQREREVLALLAEGLSNQELAQRLYLSRKTVERHVRNVLVKLGLRNRTEAAAWVIRHPLGARSGS